MIATPTCSCSGSDGVGGSGGALGTGSRLWRALEAILFGGGDADRTVGLMFKSAPIRIFILVFLIGAAAGKAADRPAENVPEKSATLLPKGWEFDFESGILWRAGHNGTYLNYVILPQILTLKTPPVARRALANGELIMRSRFSLLIEPIIRGPENHFVAATASGMLEWWNASRTFSLFFSSGGGLGGLDSKGYEVNDAQGQDLNFTWFVYPGARFRASPNCSLSVGLYYQHLSNRDMDKINPGIDAVGPLLSFGWHF
jgi:lipid A 3-O-deacylase